MELGDAGRCRMIVRFAFSSIVIVVLLATAWLTCAAEIDSMTKLCPATGPLLLNADGALKTLSERVLAGRAIGCVAPKFPALSRQVRLDGYVRVGVLVNETGRVACVHLISGHPLLIGSAIEAAHQWVFSTVTQNGRPVSITVFWHFTTQRVGWEPPRVLAWMRTVIGSKLEAPIPKRSTFRNRRLPTAVTWQRYWSMHGL
jgi:TonB family protein